MSARSAVYTINSSGPSTDPCGTEQTMYTMDDVELLSITRNDLPDRYDRNHARTVPRKPNELLRSGLAVVDLKWHVVASRVQHYNNQGGTG